MITLHRAVIIAVEVICEVTGTDEAVEQAAGPACPPTP